MMKYLFLDIDGVLNHEQWYKEEKPSMDYWWQSCFDPECVERVNNILKETGARLVVSSSWRHDDNLEFMFKTAGLPTDFDITPRSDDRVRGEEINEFLENHACDDYVILDDDMDFTEEQLRDHFVHCCADYPTAMQEDHTWKTGLTDVKMDCAISILNK